MDKTEVRLGMSAPQLFRIAVGLIFGKTDRVPDFIKDDRGLVRQVVLKDHVLDPFDGIPPERTIDIRRNQFGIVTGFASGPKHYETVKILSTGEVSRLADIHGLNFRFHATDRIKLVFDNRRPADGCSLILETTRNDVRVALMFDMVTSNRLAV